MTPASSPASNYSLMAVERKSKSTMRVNQMITPTEDYYPSHDCGELAPIVATTVATWRRPSFPREPCGRHVEGAVFVSVYSRNRVDRYDPATRSTATFAELPEPPMGLAFDAS